MKNHIPQDDSLLRAKAAELKRQMDTGSFVVCPSQDPLKLVAMGYKISPGFMVRQKNKDRLVINQKRLNTECRKKSMKYEMLKEVAHIAQKGWYFQSRDLVDGYGHIFINPGDRRDMACDMGVNPHWHGPRYVMCAALPFGYVNAPWVFSKFLKPIIAELRAQGIALLVYLDDLLIAAKSASACDRAARIVDATMQRYGLRCHTEKGQHTSLQTIDHLGLRLDSKRGLFLSKPDTVHKIQKMARQLIGCACSQKRRVHARWLAQFAGLCISQMLAISHARYHTRGIFDTLTQGGVYTWKHKWDAHVRVSKGALRNLKWWRDLGTTDIGRAVWRPPVQTTLATDASMSQWGGVLNKGLPVDIEHKQDSHWGTVSA